MVDLDAVIDIMNTKLTRQALLESGAFTLIQKDDVSVKIKRDIDLVVIGLSFDRNWETVATFPKHYGVFDFSLGSPSPHMNPNFSSSISFKDGEGKNVSKHIGGPEGNSVSQFHVGVLDLGYFVLKIQLFDDEQNPTSNFGSEMSRTREAAWRLCVNDSNLSSSFQVDTGCERRTHRVSNTEHAGAFFKIFQQLTKSFQKQFHLMLICLGSKSTGASTDDSESLVSQNMSLSHSDQAVNDSLDINQVSGNLSHYSKLLDIIQLEQVRDDATFMIADFGTEFRSYGSEKFMLGWPRDKSISLAKHMGGKLFTVFGISNLCNGHASHLKFVRCEHGVVPELRSASNSQSLFPNYVLREVHYTRSAAAVGKGVDNVLTEYNVIEPVVTFLRGLAPEFDLADLNSLLDNALNIRDRFLLSAKLDEHIAARGEITCVMFCRGSNIDWFSEPWQTRISKSLFRAFRSNDLTAHRMTEVSDFLRSYLVLTSLLADLTAKAVIHNRSEIFAESKVETDPHLRFLGWCDNTIRSTLVCGQPKGFAILPPRSFSTGFQNMMEALIAIKDANFEARPFNSSLLFWNPVLPKNVALRVDRAKQLQFLKSFACLENSLERFKGFGFRDDLDTAFKVVIEQYSHDVRNYIFSQAWIATKPFTFKQVPLMSTSYKEDLVSLGLKIEDGRSLSSLLNHMFLFDVWNVKRKFPQYVLLLIKLEKETSLPRATVLSLLCHHARNYELTWSLDRPRTFQDRNPIISPINQGLLTLTHNSKHASQNRFCESSKILLQWNWSYSEPIQELTPTNDFVQSFKSSLTWTAGFRQMDIELKAKGKVRYSAFLSAVITGVWCRLILIRRFIESSDIESAKELVHSGSSRLTTRPNYLNDTDLVDLIPTTFPKQCAQDLLSCWFSGLAGLYSSDSLNSRLKLMFGTENTNYRTFFKQSILLGFDIDRDWIFNPRNQQMFRQCDSTFENPSWVETALRRTSIPIQEWKKLLKLNHIPVLWHMPSNSEQIGTWMSNFFTVEELTLLKESWKAIFPTPSADDPAQIRTENLGVHNSSYLITDRRVITQNPVTFSMPRQSLGQGHVFENAPGHVR